MANNYIQTVRLNGTVFKETLRNYGITIVKAAEIMGVTKGTAHKYFRQNQMPLDKFVAISAYMATQNADAARTDYV